MIEDDPDREMNELRRMSDENCDALWEKYRVAVGIGLVERMPPRYVLENGAPREEPNWIKWTRWMADLSLRKVDFTVVKHREPRRYQHPDFNCDYASVSTIFLGYSISGKFFETLVQGGISDGAARRYSTLAEAKAGHWKLVCLVRESSNWARRRRHGRWTKKRFERLKRFDETSEKRGVHWSIKRLEKNIGLWAEARSTPAALLLPDTLTTAIGVLRSFGTAHTATARYLRMKLAALVD